MDSSIDYNKFLKPFVLTEITVTGKEIGRGTFGRVFEVKYCGVIFAAKRILSILLKCSPRENSRKIVNLVLHECYLKSICHHPNVVQFIGIYYQPNSVYSDKGCPSMVMELMECSLTTLIEQNQPRIALHKVLSILHDVSLGMWYLHSRNPPVIYYKNLSPNNILVNTSTMVAKISGFGIPSPLDDLGERLPGQMDFLPPDFMQRNAVYSMQSDVFGYGEVAICAAVGEWPTPTDRVIVDPRTRKMMALSEVKRRQQYLDKMVGEAEVLRPLVEECLSSNPAVRPTMETLSKRINELKKNYTIHPSKTEAEKDKIIQQKDRQLQQKDQQLAHLEQEIQEKHQKILQKDRELEQQNQQLRQQGEQLHQQSKEKQQKNQQIQQPQGNKNDNKSTWVVNRQEIRISKKLLGAGGWGSVREGIFCGCKVAVKSIDNEIISSYNLRLFVREMDMAARCRHPNLMQFIAATNEGIPLIVTELMHTSLRKILQQGQLCSNQIFPILLGVAYGLNYLHKTTPNPILHRDISSANVLLNPLANNQWHAKLSDFGSANFMRASHTVGAGNPLYAAPEALKPEGPHTPAMDVFSFGVLMYEMCSREFPADKPHPSMLNHVKWDVTESRLVGMIRSCLSHEIKGRPSMDDLIYGLNC